MTGHGFEVQAGLGLQSQRVSSTNPPRSRRHFEFGQPVGRTCRWKQQMRVAVHETRHYDPPAGADLYGLTGKSEVLDAAGGTHFLQNTIVYQQGPIVYDG